MVSTIMRRFGTARGGRSTGARGLPCFPLGRPSSAPGAPDLGGQQLGELDGVEGRALAQVVAHGEEGDAVAGRPGPVGAHAPHEGAVAPGGLERAGHVVVGDAGGLQSLLDVNIEDILKAYEDKTVDELKKVI